ncbi:hypothetical protein [Formosa algae]|uniref:DUF4738 domain-containing protein n=1 Tax=Formosa algae TaxID=225843 RepID=A0A9X1CD10_9FLAO|nr:hypothetical protein [Formosa algae]MBP1840845.1 hypothetical protein [Formosa algae]MDQ0336258.1 hypothetical protein [Formosa algae]OEI80287.1 hypothetical protein AST99_09720 [Formosa algae]
MYKILYHNILQFSILLLIVTCSSCDGRDKSHKKPKQILADNGLLESFSERINYVPEHYTETVTDTILHTGYHVRIKSYTDMNSNILTTEKKDSLDIKTFFRTPVAEVAVDFKNETIFNHIISKTFISDKLENVSEALHPYQLKSVWIDDDHIASTDTVQMQILFCKPNVISDHKSFLLSISKTGDYKITEIKTKF